MTLSTLLSALSKRGASEALVRAGSEIQICVDGQWRAQTANLTDAALNDMIARSMPLDEETAWRVPNGRASFSAQGYGVEATKQAGAVVVKLKQLSKASGGPLSVQSAGELKNSAFANSTTFAPSADSPQTALTIMPASELVNLPPVAPAPLLAPAPPLPASPTSDSTGSLVDEWYYCNLNGVQSGPVSWIKIRTHISMRAIDAQSLVWKEGMSDWLPLEKTELSRLLSQNENTALKESNDSGNKDAVLPKGLEGPNWGAGFLTVFWCFFHNLPHLSGAILGLYLLSSLLTLVFPPLICVSWLIPFATAIYMIVKGNEMAWRNRIWLSRDEFETVQGMWARWASFVFFFGILLSFMPKSTGK